MKHIKYLLLGIIATVILSLSIKSYAATVLFPFGGGTGIGSATVGDVGDCLKVTDNSPFTYELGSCGSGGTDTFTSVVASSGGDYTTLKDAVDAACAASGGTIFVRDGTYTETATITGCTNLHIVLSQAATIQANGASVSPLFNAGSGNSRIIIEGGKWLQTNATAQGTAFDMSNLANTWIRNVRVEEFGLAFDYNDTASTTFYNQITDSQVFNSNSCVRYTGTQANNNSLDNVRCRPKAGGTGIGFQTIDARGITIKNSNVEPATAAGITGISIDATSREITIINTWLENNTTGLTIASGANRVTVIGGSITSNTTDISDAGTNTVFLNTSDTGVLVNSLGALTVSGLTHSGLTTGSVVFSAASGVVSQDNTNLFWDDTNNRLGILTNSPAVTLDLTASGSTVRSSVYRGNFFNDVTGAISIFQATTTQMLLNNTTGTTASSPFLTFIGDTNTGLFRPSADVVALTAGAVEGIRFGIGGLVINEDAADYDFRIESDTLTSALAMDGATGNISVATLDTDATPPTTSGVTKCVISDENALLSFTDCGSGSGDITAVGDVASGAAFDGTQGTILTFNDADGDHTLAFDTTGNFFEISTSFLPATTDGAALGSTSQMFSDLFLASGGVINFNNGDVTLTHSADLVAIAGGSLRTNDIQLTTGSGVRTGTSAGNTVLLQARDVDGAAYTTFGTLTANDTPTFNLSAAVTVNSQLICTADGTNCPAAGAGDVTSVGDVASGAAFDGTQGTTLTFNDADGDKTFLYNTTSNAFELNDDLTFTAGVLSVDTLTLTGTGTINGLDAVDATSEATIEAAIDTLANLTSVQGQTISLSAPFTLAADPNADRILFWDDSAGATAYLTASTGLTITTTSITVDLGTAITSSEITDGEIVNADVNASAAIDYSKLALTNSLLEADLKAVDSAVDEECLTYESTTGDFEWQTCGSGAGDFVGPASSTDNAIVRFDSTTGKLGQNSGVTIGDSNEIAFTIADATSADGLTITQNDPDETGVKVIYGGASGATSQDYPFLAQVTDAGTLGALYATYHNSATPAALDLIGGFDSWGKDSAGNDELYAYFNTAIISPTNTTEIGGIEIGAKNGAAGFSAIIDMTGTGVLLSDDGDGALTITGQGNGNDENLIFNFDDPAGGSNSVSITSSTSVASIQFTSLNIDAGSFAIAGNTAINSSNRHFAPGGDAAATPNYSLDLTDSNVGIFYGGTDILGIATAGTERATFPAAGGFQLGAGAGILFTQDGDGALTLLGQGDGSDEDLTVNLDDTANTARFSSSTGLNLLDFATNSLDVSVLNEEFGVTWASSTEVPTKGAIYNKGYNPNTFDLWDEFASGTCGTCGFNTGFGNMNWLANGTGVSTVAPEEGHPGIARLTSSTSANSASHLRSDQTGVGIVTLNQGNATVEWVAKVSATTSIEVRLGVGNDMSGPSDGYYWELDTAANANWRCRTIRNGSATTGASTQAPDTNWHNFKIVVNAAGDSVSCYIDNVLITTVANSDNTDPVLFGAYSETLTTAVRNTDLDMFRYTITGLDRD